LNPISILQGGKKLTNAEVKFQFLIGKLTTLFNLALVLLHNSFNSL
ncbi:hypothetical protein HMPREF0322_04603, partial [Desulfitobacterium hafniense DP7]